jgi:hypothetical protein
VKKTIWSRLVVSALCALLLVAGSADVARAAIPPPGPQDGTAGLQGTVKTPPPTTAPTIAVPTSGQTFTNMPITVSGTCTTDLLIKIFANNVFVGSALCTSGSYSLQVTLFEGRNDLVARQFDALDQPGPDSNIVTVTFNNVQFQDSGIPQLTLTSPYARKGANPGEELVWPITISGGTSPYAVSVDWGDGKGQSLSSQPFAGTFNITHVYDSAGVYTVIIRATDKNGQTAFLQLVGQANGAIGAGGGSGAGGDDSNLIIITKVIWIPAALCIPLIILSFWLGRRYELLSLRRHLERRDDES